MATTNPQTQKGAELKNMVLVSVIVPTYNRAHLLKETLGSILAQTHKDLEVIVIEDGATDETENVVLGLDRDEKRIRFIRLNHCGNPPRVRNAGIRAATGSYIAFCDDDDLWAPEKIAKQLEVFNRNAWLWGVGCDCTEFPGIPKPVLALQGDHIVSFTEMLRGNNLCFMSGMVVRRIPFLPLLDERPTSQYLEDYELGLRILKVHDSSISILKEPLFRYRLHATRRSPAWYADFHVRKTRMLARYSREGKYRTIIKVARIKVGAYLGSALGKVLRSYFKRRFLETKPAPLAFNDRLLVFIQKEAIGGLKRFVTDLLAHWRGDAMLVCDPGNPMVDSTGRNTQLINLDYPSNKRRAIAMITRRIAFLKNYDKITRTFKAWDAGSILIVNGGYPGDDTCRAAILAAARTGTQKRVLSVLSTPVPSFVSGSPSISGFIQRAFQSIDWVIDDIIDVYTSAIHVNCSLAREEMISFIGFEHDIVHVVPTGIMLPEKTKRTVEFHDSQHNLFKQVNSTWVGTVGRLDPLKGIEYLIRAFEFLKWDKRICCLIVGKGEDESRLLQISQDLGVQDQVFFSGEYEGDINDVYRFLDIFVCPSLHEGLPYVVEEAMSHGLPVIASDVGGMPDLIFDGINGLLVPPTNPRAIADAILRLVGNPPFLELVGKNAKNRIEEKFTIEKMVAGMEALLK